MCSKQKCLIIRQAWWCRVLISALVRQRQADLSEFKASLIYKANSWAARATHRNPVFKHQENQSNKIKYPIISKC